jgi:hypothetical protein
MMGNRNRRTRETPPPCVDDDTSTPHHHCEQLLAWWIIMCKTTPLVFVRGFFLFILFHLKLVVTAPSL